VKSPVATGASGGRVGARPVGRDYIAVDFGMCGIKKRPCGGRGAPRWRLLRQPVIKKNRCAGRLIEPRYGGGAAICGRPVILCGLRPGGSLSRDADEGICQSGERSAESGDHSELRIPHSALKKRRKTPCCGRKNENSD